jgi:MHS family proline/betaine transporter-like MFS transporter
MKQNNILTSAISGNILEYYDFTVFTIFIEVIGRNFFPQASSVSQVLYGLAVFATGFITRPIGGIVFGYIGDKFGRKLSLILSMLGMTVPTFCIGLLPTYAQIGILAPLLLVVCRLVQGLCISGEGAGTAIFVLEHDHNLKPGFVTSLVHASNIAGTLIASFIGIFLEHFYPGNPNVWRFAFLLGGAFGLAGLYLRLKVSETPIFQMLLEKKKSLKSPFLSVVKNSWRAMVLTFFCGAVTSSLVYLVKTYVKVFYYDVMHLDNKVSLFYLSYCSFVLMLSMPFFGFLSDLFDRAKVIICATIAILLLIIPTLLLMSGGSTIQHLMALTLLGILAGSISGVSYLFVISLFRPEERFSGVAFSYNFGIAIFGGTSAIISRYLVERTGLFYAPGFYIILTSSLFLIALAAVYKSKSRARFFSAASVVKKQSPAHIN